MRTALLSTAGILFVAGVVLAADGAKVEPRYDPAASIEVKATINEVREVPDGDVMAGLHLIVKTETETFDVYVGPTDFVKEFGGNYAKDDKVQVTGCRVKQETGDIILAREVKEGELALVVRDKDGTPNWKYWKKAK